MNLAEIDLPLFIFAVVANLTLGAVVFLYAERNLSRKLFLAFVTSQVLWISFNYLGFLVPKDFFLLTVRTTFAFAILHSFFFLLFIKNFLSKGNIAKDKFTLGLFIASLLVIFLLYTRWLLDGVMVSSEGILTPHTNVGFPIFGVFVLLLIGYGFLSLIIKYREAKSIERLQWKFLTIGLVLTFLLVLVFSFSSFVITGKPDTVKFGHLYTLPFVVFTTYAIVRHHMLNLKTILAEISVVLLNVLLLIRFLTSENITQFIISGVILLGTIIVGVLLIRGVYREIKQREQLEILTKQLEDANTKLKDLDKARAEFISIASHQLRTPPATIKWYLAAIKSGDYGKFDSGVGETLVKAEITNNAQISLIDDLLNASRIERGKMEFLFEEGDFIALTQMAYDQLVPQAAMKKLELKFNRPVGTFPLVIMDKEKLRQVINNFIDNAIKYTKQGSVVVNIFSDNQNIGVKVTDTGKGFSPEIGPVLFEKYTRGKDSVMHSQGLGLGLYVAKVIIEKHNGKIWAESPGEGKGSTFSFSVPIHNTITPSSTSTLDLTQSQGEHK